MGLTGVINGALCTPVSTPARDQHKHYHNLKDLIMAAGNWRVCTALCLCVCVCVCVKSIINQPKKSGCDTGAVGKPAHNVRHTDLFSTYSHGNGASVHLC